MKSRDHSETAKCKKRGKRNSRDRSNSVSSFMLWHWRKRERNLTFIEAKIRTGNGVEKTDSRNDSGTAIAGNKSLPSLEGRYV